MANITHLYFSTDTLGFSDNSVILTMGVIPFTFEDPQSPLDLIKSGLSIKFNIEEQIKSCKRTVDKNVLGFWQGQTKECKERYFYPNPKKDLSIQDGLSRLNEFIKSSGYDYKHSFVWANISSLTFPMIKSLFNNAIINDSLEPTNIKPGFNFNMVRDGRTMVDCLSGSTNGSGDLPNLAFKGYDERNSLHRSALNVIIMQTIYKNLFNPTE